ncbi:cytochrome c biogenesis protein CcsA [Paucihalobacter sp.]|uniref:cytochrome c biogenesis protein CcsA n=1 Tax=Paucihalobacter sp. TaxID=2850405 RepID=UPI002FE38C64
MQKKIAQFLFSTRLTAVLFIVFAVAMAVGTFLDAGEETSPTAFTRQMIYNTWWFEAIMMFFVINFVGNIFRFRLYKRPKWSTLILHLAFILILVGAFVTRYIGFEGMMAIREGETEQNFLSQKTYVTVYVDGDYKINGVAQRYAKDFEVDFSYRLDNEFDHTITYDQQEVNISLEKYIKGAELDVVPNDNGDAYLKMVEATDGKPHNHFLKDGTEQLLHNMPFTLNNPKKGAINITEKDGQLFIESPFEGEYMTMATGTQGTLLKDSIQPLALRSRYVIGNLQMVFPKPIVKGVFEVVKKPQILKGDEDGIVLNVSSNGETKQMNILGGQFINNPFQQEEVGGLKVAVKYGPKVLELPFQIKLNDFIAERYPGTEKSYSSYESKVTVIDPNTDPYDYRIYMNNILDHGGYRFFQASFDPDEKGTILSVNHDYWGTWLTYVGYFLLYFGMIAILFDKKSRFGELAKTLTKVRKKKEKIITVFLLCFALTGFSQEHFEGDGHDHGASIMPSKAQIDSVLAANIAPRDHALKFGNLVVQDFSGRMMPVDTYASELVRKLSKSDQYEDFNANQLLLSMQESPLLWYNVPIIYIKPKKGDSIRSLIGIPQAQKYASLVDFFTPNGSYKLAPYLEEAYKAQVPNGFQKEFKETDQRVNLLYNTLDGRAMKFFPIPEDENNTWVSPTEFREQNLRERIADSMYANFINNGISTYLYSLNNAKQSGNFAQAEGILNGITKLQQTYGSEVMLSEDKIKAEVLYNKYDIFKQLFSWYMYAGVLMFIVLMVQIFKSKSLWIDRMVIFFKVVIFALFLLHTFGLIARWYISGHAPWSDAYESMIYVAWATMAMGLAFGRKSDLTIASTAFVTAMILMIAHWNWMDPAIANLQPVLDSYWLMIHVAVIVGSYGPFTIGMVLGVVTLLLMIFTNAKNKVKMDINIKELVIINELALTVGLVMLTIGNFLGGMWANESWGRYWGWDPKETWALISIMVYAFVIHMRLVPGLRGRWFFSLMSIVAFASIIMTYFGVNFYLAGLHSYASGDQILSYKFIGVSCAIVAVLGFFAYRKYKRFYA